MSDDVNEFTVVVAFQRNLLAVFSLKRRRIILFRKYVILAIYSVVQKRHILSLEI